jgi:hypothetical protein
MAGSPEKEKETQGVTGRRSTRLSISVPITISGQDSAGRTFKENTKTLIINKHGAKVSMVHELTLGAEVTIENRALGETSKANVVWVGDRASLKDPVEMELQLREAQNMWGIEFPPSDWKEDAPASVGDRKLEKPIATGTEPPVAKAPVKAAGPPPPATLPLDASEIAIGAAMAQFAQMTRGAAQAELKSFEEQLAKLANEFGFRSQSSLQEAANRLEEKTVQSLEQQLGVLEGRLRASHDEFETLLTRFQELQKSIQGQVEKTQHSIQDATWEALQAALMELEGKVREDLDAASSGFIQQTRQCVREEASAAMEAFNQRTSRHLASLTEDFRSKATPELQARQKQITDEARTQIVQVLQAASTQLREKIHQIANEAAPSLGAEMEASLVGYGEQLTNRLTQFFEEQTQAFNQAAGKSLQQSLEKVQRAIQQEILGAGARDNHTPGASDLFHKVSTVLRHLLLMLKNAWRNLHHTILNILTIGLTLCLLGTLMPPYLFPVCGNPIASGPC